MENSIEEDIKILERFSNENVIYGSTVGMTLEKYKDLQLSAEHILSDYKRVLKINEVLLKENEQLKSDIKNMYDEEVVISIIEDNFNLCRNEVLEMLRSEE